MFARLDLCDATLVAYSMGSFEAARYAAGAGASRIARLVFVPPTTPFLTRAPDNPAGIPREAALACRRAVATTDSRADLAAIRKRTLVLQGDKDASAPLALTGAKTAQLIPRAELRVYEGAPHALRSPLASASSAT